MVKPRIPFLILEENQLAYTALERLILRQNWVGQELLFLYGESGSGKTALVQQLLTQERKKRPRQIVESLTASELSALFTEAIATQSIDQFQDRFEQVELLICEDLQALQNRKEPQDRLIQLLDDLNERGGRVVLTANQSPGSFKGVSRRLVNRCHGGLNIQLGRLSTKSRQKLLTHLATSQQIAIPANIVTKLARTIKGTARDLMAALNQLDAVARLNQVTISEQLCNQFLKGEIDLPKPEIKTITRIVSQEFGVKISDVRSSARDKKLVLARQCAMFLAREIGEKPLRDIAHYFGGRNHSTVIHSCRRFQERLESDVSLTKELQEILQRLGIPAEKMLITC